MRRNEGRRSYERCEIAGKRRGETKGERERRPLRSVMAEIPLSPACACLSKSSSLLSPSPPLCPSSCVSLLASRVKASMKKVIKKSSSVRIEVFFFFILTGTTDFVYCFVFLNDHFVTPQYIRKVIKKH